MSSSTSTTKGRDVPQLRKRSPQFTHRGEGSNYVLPAGQSALEPPVPMSPAPNPSENAAQPGAQTEFDMVNARSDLTADEKLDTMLQMQGEEQRKRATEEAKQRVFGTRNAETPGKRRSRSPSSRERHKSAPTTLQVRGRASSAEARYYELLQKERQQQQHENYAASCLIENMALANTAEQEELFQRLARAEVFSQHEA